mgnify:CR=1 FL=1|jgi:predicted RNase H-related nuclease YkuK (DUF458 family)|tara:strand:+ start:1282 stop:1767 length:486 start_codon:yes stop_codon:yes gene_type:complete
MKLLNNKKWRSGSGKNVDFNHIFTKIKNHSFKNNKIFIGSDSYITRKKICFVTAVCLLTKNKGGNYFFYKEMVPLTQYRTLSVRITEEVRRSIELAENFINIGNVLPEMIELHLDVSSPNKKNGTSKFSDMLTGYVQGYGIACKLKPDAWASQSVADRHSK